MCLGPEWGELNDPPPAIYMIGPNMAPLGPRPHEAPRWLQDGPKMATRWPPGWPKIGPRWPKLAQDEPKRPQDKKMLLRSGADIANFPFFEDLPRKITMFDLPA